VKHYYTDDELIELVESIGDSTNSYYAVADRIRERFKQKDLRIEMLQQRVNVAAEYLGHNLITDLVEEQY
jgi:hypothetical protein